MLDCSHLLRRSIGVCGYRVCYEIKSKRDKAGGQDCTQRLQFVSEEEEEDAQRVLGKKIIV